MMELFIKKTGFKSSLTLWDILKNNVHEHNFKILVDVRLAIILKHFHRYVEIMLLLLLLNRNNVTLKHILLQ